MKTCNLFEFFNTTTSAYDNKYNPFTSKLPTSISLFCLKDLYSVIDFKYWRSNLKNFVSNSTNEANLVFLSHRYHMNFVKGTFYFVTSTVKTLHKISKKCLKEQYHRIISQHFKNQFTFYLRSILSRS